MRAALIGLLLTLAACPASSAPPPRDEPASRDAVPWRALLSETWPVRLADDAVRAPFEASPGWRVHVIERRYVDATRELPAGLPRARAHADLASAWRMGTLTVANALIETYDVRAEASDPAGVAHLVAVAYAIRGDIPSARAWSARVAEGDATWRWHAPWRAWLDGGAVGVPDLSGLLAMPADGGLPGVGPLPHYVLPERTPEARGVEMGDPGVMLAVSRWHDARAVAEAGADGLAVRTAMSRFLLPIEGSLDAPAPSLPDDLLFGSDLLHPGDGAFFADLLGAGGAGAVDAHRSTSLMAALAAASRGEDGRVDGLSARGLMRDLRGRMLDDMRARSGGERAFHRTFAESAVVASLRGIGLVALREGDRRTGGSLLKAADDRDHGPAWAWESVLFLAAWDAGNGQATRPADAMHQVARLDPRLEVGRYALDRMQLRTHVPGAPD